MTEKYKRMTTSYGKLKQCKLSLAFFVYFLLLSSSPSSHTALAVGFLMRNQVETRDGVSVLKKKQVRNPSLQYRKAKELTVKLIGLTSSFNSKVLRP